MKKVVLIALAIVMALGCVSAFAAAPKMTKDATIENGRTVFVNGVGAMYMEWLRDGVNEGEWGGGDQWGPKTGVTTQDCTLGLRGVFAINEGGSFVEYPEIQRLGYVYEGEDDIIWFDNVTITPANEIEGDYAFVDAGSLQSWTATCVEVSIDTSTMKAGEYNIQLVVEYDDTFYTWAQNQDGDGQWVVTTIRSTGANYVAPVDENNNDNENENENENENQNENTETGDVSVIVAIVAVAALAVVVLKKKETV